MTSFSYGFSDELTKIAFNWTAFNDVLQSIVIPAMITGGLGTGIGLLASRKSEEPSAAPAVGGLVGAGIGAAPGAFYHLFSKFPDVWDYLATAAKAFPAVATGAGVGASVGRLTAPEDKTTQRTLLGGGLGAAALGIPAYYAITRSGW